MLNTDVGQVFDTWSEVEYKGYKAMSADKDWCSVIRQKINNIYTRYFDKNVILHPDYMYLLNTPKRLYYQWIDGIDMDSGELTNIIDDSIDKAIKLKTIYQKQKMDLSWNEYKKVIEDFLYRAFNNCKLIEEYESQSNFRQIYDFINEDNFYIRYFCKTLEYEIKQWQKKYYGVRSHKTYRRCADCGKLVEIKSKKDYSTKYCESCKKERTLKKYSKYNKKRTLPPS